MKLQKSKPLKLGEQIKDFPFFRLIYKLVEVKK